MYEWDDFYYDNRNIRLLNSNKIWIGRESWLITDLLVNFRRNFLRGHQWKKTFLGFPVEYDDDIRDKISFSKAKANIDGKKKLIKSFRYSGSSNLLVKCDVNYLRTIETIKYFGYMDMLAKLGGLKSILGPVLSILTPIFVLAFLIELCSILKQSYKNDYFKELYDTIHQTIEELNQNDYFKKYLQKNNKKEIFRFLTRQVKNLPKDNTHDFEEIDLNSNKVLELEEIASKVL